ncbi:BTAD domain-containing putative transcriptional regulator [Nonomuraea sp. NEAU-A123]|uniref:BTAD domain-containing putative transcriptional regulator n=1 Tax=Nonomuraea sp. NEAU-A123 TaxID=2839649 RepID=UPI001BE48A6C|nr:BTAD domain-containing putative transcriptional regulator [Nonomuraea sp. NEAU-A123]MBT2230752.1 tetratricopeptide repeat protein [Nonomuraea sp. NEAU-A123]
MRFGILGSTRAWRADGGEVPLGGRARRALLALLLIRPGEVVTYDRLIDVLYGEQPPKNAQHALHSQVSRLRGDGIMVERAATGYRLAVDPGDVDAHRFLRLAEAGRQALDADPDRAAALLGEALSLWRGAALADLDAAHAVPLEERHVAAQEDRIEADLRRGAHRAVIPELGGLIERHPLRERLRGQLMRALSADGRPAEALVVYEQARRLLADELGADPSPELSGLHQSLLRGELARLPSPAEQTAPAPAAVGSGDSGRLGRPIRLTTLVGRAYDLAAVGALLDSARLVTLLGPGGAGKTRLAVEVAGQRPDTCLAELASLTEGAGLPQAVLGALGVREGGLLGSPVEPSAEPAALWRLIAALAERPLLLVLDNCEHLIEDAAALAERLLAACPRLRILATSREPLGITAEHLWPLRPLATADAVRLFTDRATAVRPGFTPDETVERICSALDGLPLAIELAAARMRTHEAPELAERLAGTDRFRLLSRGSRTADARHQTLRAVVAWSWELLTEPERAMAARLTVFSGGATATAAAEVCGLADAEELLDSLADKSLVTVTNGRYRMLETIRAFCAEQLADEASVRRAHATYFLGLAQEADPHLRAAEQLDWLEALSAEHDNLRTALRWTAEAGEVRLGIRLLAAQSTYLWMRGMRGTATASAVALLEAAGPAPDPELGDAYVLCLLTVAGGEAAGGLWARHSAAAIAIVSAGEGTREYPVLTFLWPMITAAMHAPEPALAVMTRATKSPDPWERGMARMMWAYSLMARGEYPRARADLVSALDALRALGDRWGSMISLDALAWLAGIHGDRATALARTDEAIVLAEELGATEDLADLLCNRGDHRLHADPAAAKADYERAAELARRVGVPTNVASALRGLGDVALEEGDLSRARELYEEALRRSDPRWLRTTGSRIRLLVGLGRLAEADGDPHAAGTSHRQAVEVAVVTGALPESARAFESLARLALIEEGGAWPAARLLGAGTVMLGGIRLDTPTAADVSARVRAVLGDEAYERAWNEGAALTYSQAALLAGVPDAAIDSSPLRMIATLPGELGVSPG